MDELMMGTIYVEVINAGLALFLLSIYYPNYRALKSNAGLGLLIFASVLLIENAVGLYLHFSAGEFYAKMVATHAFVLKFFEMIALGVLAYTAWKE